MSKVGIVCDSTCDLGPQWLADNDVHMVPLKVLFGEDTFLDWIDLDPQTFFGKLTNSTVLPKTSQPSPAEFVKAYETLAEQGCDSIISVHLSAALSGTFESAMLARGQVSVPVDVVDTKLISFATGLVVQAGVSARDKGLDHAGILSAVEDAAGSTRLFFILDTLEYLVKGGRAGKASGLAATLLNIKPVLTVNSDGIIEPFRKVKGMRKAITEIARHVAEDTAGSRVSLALLYANEPSIATEMRAGLDSAGVVYDLDAEGSVGAVIGTYAGPGAVGVAYRPVG